MRESTADIAVVGCGAAGLYAAIWAGRTAQQAGRTLRVCGIDGAAKLGAKILVAGGGRCNVTHHAVSERDFAGSTPAAIRKVLRAYGVPQTVEFFRGLGVQLKQEETGKLFPTTDDAHTVLNALLGAAGAAGVELIHPARVEGLTADADGFMITGAWGTVRAQRTILCTGGCALPKSGSDGAGYAFVQSLGHTITAPVIPALVPLVLEQGHWLTELQGLAAPAQLTVRSGTGKVLATATGAVLCTHFGVSGPAVLDISRHLTMARSEDPAAALVLSWLPGTPAEVCDQQLVEWKQRSILEFLRPRLPERLARAACAAASVDPHGTAQQLPRDARRKLVANIAGLVLPVVRDRGFTFAEATAGGVPLSEVHLDTMESRIHPRLYLAGEICDVDGRIGGFNFQWAWSSGHAAGCAAARAA